MINIHRDSTWSHFGELNKSDLSRYTLKSSILGGTACGSLQLVSYRSDLEVYAPDAASFDTKDVFLELIEKYLYDDERREHKARDVTKAIESHTYQNRAVQIIDTHILVFVNLVLRVTSIKQISVPWLGIATSNPALANALATQRTHR